MKGNPTIIKALNALLANELSAMDQYFLHSEMYRDWGLTKLYERISHEFDDEKGHATKLIERILFLEGTPNMKDREPINIGSDVPSMLQSDLDIEYAVQKMLTDTIALCEKEQDYGTRDMLEPLLDDTEMDHTYYLEQQLRLIKMIGLPKYLQSQM
ncbi:bacterioferritin [Saccharospirillum impatiens]|uniref:bacterioferritin n=1 Tax=Saccharospirillum impatiens TaxID=169438 RepID=UPI00042A7574|nr:bacterioferritin [Saccharospirillum impatiens]